MFHKECVKEILLRWIHMIDVTDFRNPVKLRADGLIEVGDHEKDVLIYEVIKREYLDMTALRDIAFRSRAVVKSIKDMGYYVTGQAVAVTVSRARLGRRHIFKMIGKGRGYTRHICDPDDFDRFYKLDEIEKNFLVYFPDLAQ